MSNREFDSNYLKKTLPDRCNCRSKFELYFNLKATKALGLTVPDLMRAAVNEYRAKAFERLSLAECTTDPECRAEFLRYARWWMQLAEPVGTPRSAYEVEPQHNRWQQILRHKG